MLRKKKDKPALSYILVLFDSNGEKLYHDALFEIPVEEEVILEKCILFFGDYDPCFIHRSAARSRILFEIEEILTAVRSDNSSIISDKQTCCAIQSLLGWKTKISQMVLSQSRGN
jgi:hypothetical protein